MEVEGRESVLELGSPNYNVRRQILALQNKKADAISGLQAKLRNESETVTSEEREQALAVLQEYENFLSEQIVGLAVAPKLESVADLERIASCEDIIQMHEWLLKKVGIARGREEEGFTKT
ncbi:MAG: hypothetical protein M0R66_01330 [Candidatus Omnitrophica bacterium]|nr:hypothetical protein [Candidatus Omnitrophota bacterium]